MYFAMPDATAGWLICDGSQLDREEYSGLFKVIQTTFGDGDGSTTFNLPDLRAEFIRGIDAERQFDDYQKGSLSAMDVSKSSINVVSIYNGIAGNSKYVACKNAGTDVFDRSDYLGIKGNFVDSGVVTEDALEYYAGVTRPRNIALLPCIKL